MCILKSTINDKIMRIVMCSKLKNIFLHLFLKIPFHIYTLFILSKSHNIDYHIIFSNQIIYIKKP